MIGLDKKDKVSIQENKKKEIEKKLILVNRILPKRGHTIWKYNINTSVLSKCEFTKDSENISLDKALEGDYKKRNKKVIIEENCIYFNALNLKNAFKILKRDYNISNPNK